jgi:C4-dicarboxylate-specific signal transduction histidine kinase
MSMTFAGRSSSLRIWTAAHVACLISIAMAALVGLRMYSEIADLKSPEEDATWAVTELGFEHLRLQMAAEAGRSLEEIRLRGEIYLGRVFVLRDAPLLAPLRARIPWDDTIRLFQSAQATDQLISSLESLVQRDALLWRLRADAPMIRRLMLDIASLNRKILWERKIENSRKLLMYLAALEVLMLALLGLAIYVFRITRKLRQAGRELAAQLATQHAILRSVDAAILVLGPEGRVLYSNAYAEALLGPDAASGALLSKGQGHEASLIADINALLAEQHGSGSEPPATRKLQCKSQAGTRHYVIRCFLTRTDGEGGETGDTIRIVAVADVTTEEEALLRRDEYDARLGEASRLLAFAAISGGIVHEISQPLAAIRNYVHALDVSLRLRQADPQQRVIVNHLGQEIDRAMEVVRNVRRMGPQEPQDSGTCDVQEALAHSVRLVTLGIDPPPAITVVHGEARVLVAGSLPMIGQVVVNLLKNALSASAAAGRAGAEVRVTQSGRFAEISVADFGTGVSADAARTLFAPFSKSARGGMGLGLAICQRIASTLGGALTWENRETAGAVFKFTVPLAKEGSTP